MSRPRAAAPAGRPAAARRRRQSARPGRRGRCVACGRPTDSARSAALAQRLRDRRRSPRSALPSTSRREFILRDHPRPAGLGHFARVDGLVIVGRDRQRNEDRRPPRRGQLGDGRGAGPGDDQMRLGQPVRHVLDIGQQLGRDVERGVAVANRLDIVGPALLDDLQPVAKLGRQHAERIRHDLAQHGRALAAAGDQNLERGGLVKFREGHGAEPGDRLPHRVADQLDLAAMARLQAARLRDRPWRSRSRSSGQQPVDPAEHGILLMQDCRNVRARWPPAAPEMPDSRRSRPPRRAVNSRYSALACRRPASTALAALIQPIGPPPSRPAGRIWVGTSSNSAGIFAPRSSVTSITPWPRAFSSAASAWAGTMCPPVPPAARVIFIRGCSPRPISPHRASGSDRGFAA